MEGLLEDNVIKSIMDEEKKHGNLEFGGYVVIDNDKVSEVIFDVREQSWGYVQLDLKNLMKVDKEKRNKVRGWFHKHPIDGLSGLDIDTTKMLTRFWGECYTLVLQSNKKLLLIKTKILKTFGRKKNKRMMVEVFRREIDYEYVVPEPVRDN